MGSSYIKNKSMPLKRLYIPSSDILSTIKYVTKKCKYVFMSRKVQNVEKTLQCYFCNLQFDISSWMKEASSLYCLNKNMLNINIFGIWIKFEIASLIHELIVEYVTKITT